jgi:16S rRNA (uracil1498-N3)-methyltransferase
MIRLFVSDDLKNNTDIYLSDTTLHYLKNVMRRAEGDEILLFNGKDGEWLSQIKTLTKKQGILTPIRQTRPQTSEKRLILCPALIKKENFDWVLQKATELGATDIYPLITERTIVSKLNLERATSIVREASEQCERLCIPTLYSPLKLTDLFKNLPPNTQPVCLSERGQTTAPLTTQKIYAFCIGPEGGWTPNELAFFEKSNTIFWHLGSTILRAETASVSALACAQFAFK